MAPKKAAPSADKKAKVAAKQKAAEDKTFGLKNKSKSSKVQKYVQQVSQQVQLDKTKILGDAAAKKDKKKAEEERQKELNDLFAMAIKQPKVPAGVDPKSIVCEFFRHGQCTKGFKCKFSHDLAVERKTAKIDLFTDRREGEDDNMEDWDQEQLEKAIAAKHGAEKPSNATSIICKFFLDAVEKKQYGWFWQCPNGKDCKYKHALPPGYVLKSQMKELLEEQAAIANRDMTEVIEEERQKVDAKTPITEETFRVWHAKRTEKRRLENEERDAERKRKGVLNGREIFLQEGFVATDDAGAADDYTHENDETTAINEMFAQAARQQAAAAAAFAATAAAGVADVAASAMDAAGDGAGSGSSGAGSSSAAKNSTGAGSSAGGSAAAGSGSGVQANGDAGAGPSSSNGAAGASSSKASGASSSGANGSAAAGVSCVAEENAHLFDDDGDGDDDDEDFDDDAADDEELGELEEAIKKRAVVS